MIKSETELKKYMVDILKKNGFSARRVESGFIKGFPDLYLSKNQKVTWIEVKFFKPEDVPRSDSTRLKLKEKLLKACTALQKNFLREEAIMGVNAFAAVGYYTGSKDIRFSVLKWSSAGAATFFSKDKSMDEFVTWLEVHHG